MTLTPSNTESKVVHTLPHRAPRLGAYLKTTSSIAWDAITETTDAKETFNKIQREEKNGLVLLR